MWYWRGGSPVAEREPDVVHACIRCKDNASASGVGGAGARGLGWRGLKAGQGRSRPLKAHSAH